MAKQFNPLDPLGVFQAKSNPAPITTPAAKPTIKAINPVYPGGLTSLSPFAPAPAPGPVMPEKQSARALLENYAHTPQGNKGSTSAFAATSVTPTSPTVSNTVKQFHSY